MCGKNPHVLYIYFFFFWIKFFHIKNRRYLIIPKTNPPSTIILNNVWPLQLPMQSVPITTKVVSWNTAHGGVYSIQQTYSDLWQVGGFLQVLWFPPQYNSNMLKVVLNTITPFRFKYKTYIYSRLIFY
jgi:hypothetical protein